MIKPRKPTKPKKPTKEVEVWDTLFDLDSGSSGDCTLQEFLDNNIPVGTPFEDIRIQFGTAYNDCYECGGENHYFTADVEHTVKNADYEKQLAKYKADMKECPFKMTIYNEKLEEWKIEKTMAAAKKKALKELNAEHQKQLKELRARKWDRINPDKNNKVES